MGTPRTLKKNDLIIERLSQSAYQTGDLVLTYRPSNDADDDIILTEVSGGGGSGTVESVNGVGPDGAGNVALTTDLVPEGAVNKYFDEAPIDGNQYARQNGGWSQVTGGGANGGIAINAAGTLAERSTYDNEAEGFVFFQTDFGQGTSVNDVYARYTATAGQTNFTLPFTPTDGPKTVLVTRNNVIQGPTNVYSTSGTTLTFTTALEAGDEVTALDLSSVLYGIGAIYIKESAASGDWSVAIPFIGSNAGGGGGAVDSVFGRVGAVTAQAGDYSSNQVDAPASATNYTPTSATALGHFQGIDTALASAGGGSVSSVFGRTGAVIANSGDYQDSQITAAASATNYSPTSATVEGHLEGIDTALGTGGGGGVNSITGSSGVTVNNSDPANPIVSLTNFYVVGSVGDISGRDSFINLVFTGAELAGGVDGLVGQQAAFKYDGSTETATPSLSNFSFISSVTKIASGRYRINFTSQSVAESTIVIANASTGYATVSDVTGTSQIEIDVDGTTSDVTLHIHCIYNV